jgi:hypothetical protein
MFWDDDGGWASNTIRSNSATSLITGNLQGLGTEYLSQKLIWWLVADREQVHIPSTGLSMMRA